jgi:hypothetical protein
VRGVPGRKDVFICRSESLPDDAIVGTMLFENISGLKVHDGLKTDESGPEGIVNPNSKGTTKRGDKFGILMVQVDSAGVATGSGGPGKPKKVTITSSFSPDQVVPIRTGEGALILTGEYPSTIAHELLHCCNVDHHAHWTGKWVDRGYVTWDIRGESLIETRAHEYSSGPERVTIPLKNVMWEGGEEVVSPERLKSWLTGAKGAEGRVFVARQHGEHSGHRDCVMRYDCAVAFIPDRLDGEQFRYLNRRQGGEGFAFQLPGLSLCDQQGDTAVTGREGPASPESLRDRGRWLLQEPNLCQRRAAPTDPRHQVTSMIMSQFTCPSCRVVLRSPRPVPAGARIRCKKCGQSFRVQAAQTRPEKPPAESQVPTAEPAPSRPARGPRRRGLLLGGILGGGAALVLLVALLLSLLNKPQPGPSGSAELTKPSGGPAPDDNGGPPSAAGPAPRPVLPPEEPPRPLFLLSGNGSGAPQVVQGWPLLAYGRLLHPRAFARDATKIQPMLLAAAEGPWTGAVRLEVRDAKGKQVDWPFHLATVAKPTVALDNQTAGYLGWWLTPEETAALPPGEYELTGTLDTSTARAAGAWQGSARSRSVRIRVTAEPKMLVTEQEEEKHLLLAHFAALRGDDKQALAHLDALLAKQPKSISGLEHKGDLLAAAGQTEAALRNYDAAIAAYLGRRRLRGQPSPEPPAELLGKHREVLVQFLRK